MHEAICEYCKKEFTRKTKFQGKYTYCSNECRNKGAGIHPTKPRTGEYKTCPICNKTFYVYRGSLSVRKYCSRICHNKAQENRPMLICKTCGNEYKTHYSQIKWRGSNYCSKICQDIAASKRKGDKSPKWRGGKSSEGRRLRNSGEWRKWRTAVFERDNYTCQECGARSNRDIKEIITLHPHHKKSFAEYPELRFDVDNGITLCSVCHYRIHGIINTSVKRIIKWTPTIKLCSGCNKMFTALRPDRITCSHRCAERIGRKRRKDAKTCKELSETL